MKMLPNTVVEMRGITKHFSNVLANSDINFNLTMGETHAVVGENGAGKSTLMKILYGQIEPDSGEILIDGEPKKYDISQALKFGIGMVHQNFMHVDELSVLENIILNNIPVKNGFIDFENARKICQKYITSFGLMCSLNTKIGGLSVGERQKIEIIKTLYIGARILILDEPTAVLTPQESKELFKNIELLKQEGKSIIFISHKLREVMEVADRITVLKKGKVTGSFNRGDVNETDLARAMVGRQDVDLLQNCEDQVSQTTVLEATRLWYIDKDGVEKLRNLSFSLHRGEILGIGGVEGNGQKELQEILIGRYKPDFGKIRLESEDITTFSVAQRRRSGIALIPEDRMTLGLSINSNIQDNLLAGRHFNEEFVEKGILKRKHIEEISNTAIEDFDIRDANLEDNVSNLSGGNLQKVILARELSENPKILIASQPTRGLDIGAINTVRSFLLNERAKGCGIVLISADLEELMSMSDRILILYEGNVSGEILRDQIRQKFISEEEIGLMMGGIVPQGVDR